MTQEFQADTLTVRLYEDRPKLGLAAAKVAVDTLKYILAKKDFANVIFAAAPSQNEFLAELSKQKDIPWKRVRAFHMDEYTGLPANAPQRFGTYLRKNFFDLVPLGEVHYLLGDVADPETECRRYADLLLRFPADLVFMGIGENTHIAFNDPHVARFNDPQMVKLVELDEACRQQQVNDGCFKNLPEVPTHALTLTVPALMKADYILCIVPGKTKAEAIYHTLHDGISERYPSTILRTHPSAVLYIDKDSGALLR